MISPRPAHRRRLASSTFLALASGLLGVACAGHPDTVTRVVDGRVEEGRFISPVSYSAYARAAGLEALQQLEAAEAAYQEALRFDPYSPEIWTRLGTVRCASGRQDAREAFDEAERIAPDFAPLWYERARCELGHDQAALALESAQRSLSLDPDYLPTTKLIADALTKLGRRDAAARYLDALVALYPHVPAVLKWRADLAGKDESGKDESVEARRAALARLDQALMGDQLAEAREIALDQDVSESELAARSVALGKVRSGLEQARALRAADPADGTAWVAELCAADLVGDEAQFSRALHALAESPGLPGPVARILFADLLKRRVGAEAARSWLAATPGGTHVDPLVTRNEARLERELSSESPAPTD